jgi:hypothetical protein
MADQDVARFIGGSFRSVWSIEVMLHLKRHADRSWLTIDLVEALRASDLVIGNSLAALLAAGIVVQDADGAARFAPASADIARLADATEALYAKKPDAVRRMIISVGTDGATAFADAFRIRRD